MGVNAEVDDLVMPDHAVPDADPRRCAIVLDLIARKWMVPILVELEQAPRRRQYLLVTLKVPGSRLDTTIQSMRQWGVIERTWIPSGRTEGPGLAITALGRSLLAEVTRLSEWQHRHHSTLLANKHDWLAAHDLGQG